MPSLRYFLLLLLLTAGAHALTLTDNDRVLFLGDTLLEREGNYGHIETRMREQFPGVRFTVRNLSWSADTPKGWSRASFDPPAKGWERLQAQIATVRPTVVILGYGMASALEELGGIKDKARYGEEPPSATRFKREMGELMDVINKGADPVQFVILSPLQVRDLPPNNNIVPPNQPNILAQYRAVLTDLAKERSALHLVPDLQYPKTSAVHPTEEGYAILADQLATQLGWTNSRPEGREPLRRAIQRRNQLHFYQWRPQNETYILGFRKHEQGQNAKELPMFDPLIAAAEEVVWKLSAQPATAAEVPAPKSAPMAIVTSPVPQFDVQEGYEIALWAENPLLEKPVQMNWDGQGRLWVASSSVYPQIEPGMVARDRIIILEDTDRNGTADKSTVFAEDLLIPTGVIPEPSPDGISRSCLVGQSTELLRLTDTDGDGRADKREIVLSGFGTEDTHHLIHTLRWCPDGELAFNQSIYIHSHIETPSGVVRQNSGGILKWNPVFNRITVLANGFINPWGHIIDARHQSFVTDGAGFEGVSWVVPGAMYRTYEGARRILQSISPGSYPKFCGLEQVASPHFPKEWQGSLVTCDFRAHRIVRFGLNDLNEPREGAKPQAGYVTSELPDIVRTSDIAFRPIDIRHGPDGALYVADWSNPVINHGEVDFRDPRRDKHRGRIWRISRKDAQPVAWKPIEKSDPSTLEARTRSANAWEKDQAKGVLNSLDLEKPVTALVSDQALLTRESPRERLLWMRLGANGVTPYRGDANLILDAAFPASLALTSAADDPFLEYAAWLSINELAEPWTKSVLAGKWTADSPQRERQLEWALGAIPTPQATQVLAHVLQTRTPTLDGTGPWIELIGKAGSGRELRRLFDLLSVPTTPDVLIPRLTAALTSAAQNRGAKPEGDLSGIASLVEAAAAKPDPARLSLLTLLGEWRLPATADTLASAAASNHAEVRRAALAGLRIAGGKDAITWLETLAGGKDSRDAVLALAALDLRRAKPFLPVALRELMEEKAAVDFWRELLKVKGAPELLLANLPADLPKPSIAAGLRMARESGKKGTDLAAALGKLAGVDPSIAKPHQSYGWMADLTKRDGDPARGEVIYRRANLACVTCHAIGGAGGKVGPELTSLGASAPMDYIIESVLAPTVKVKEGYNAVALTLRDGSVTTGMLSRETPEQIWMRDVTGVETAVAKSAVAGRETVGSLMPAGLVEALPQREQWDLYAFLGQLGKPGVYDASKGAVARTWWLSPDKATAGTPAFTQVDGNFPREMLKESLGAATFGTVRFTAPAAGNIRFTVAGASSVSVDGAAPIPVTNGIVEAALPAGEHTLTVTLDALQLPEGLRVAAENVRFLGN